MAAPHAEMTLNDLAQYFHLPMAQVARKLGVCATVLKKHCRKLGIPRWPHRKMKSFEKQLSILESSVPRDTEDQERIELEMQFILRQRNDLMKDPARHMCKRQTIPKLVLSASRPASVTTHHVKPLEMNDPRLSTGGLVGLVDGGGDIDRPNSPVTTTRPPSRRQSTSHSSPSDVDLLPLFESRPERTASPPNPNFVSSIVPFPVVTTATTTMPLHMSSAPIVVVPSIQPLDTSSMPPGDPKRLGPVRRLSNSGLPPPGFYNPEPIAAVDASPTTTEAPQSQPARRRSTSYFSTIPINGPMPPASVFPFPTESLAPYTVCQPQANGGPQYQILQQQFYHSQPAQSLYLWQTAAPQAQVVATQSPAAPMYFNPPPPTPQTQDRIGSSS